MSTKTSEGLRDRLFDTLDSLIEKKIGKEEVEAVCYISEQIIKTAHIELEFAREFNKNEELKRHHELSMKREEKNSIALLSRTIESVSSLNENNN